MDSSTLSNEVLRLLLAQNNLPITGSRENLLKRLNSIPTGVSQIPERRENPPRTRRSDQRQPAPKRARSTTCTTVQPAQTSSRPDPEEISVLQDESADLSDSSGPSSSTIQDGGVQEERGVPRSTTALAQMIASIVDDKLQSFGTNRLSPLASSQPACQPERLSNPPFEQQLSDPSFVSSLLTQPTSGNLSTPPSSCSPSPIAAHVPHKTRQAILNGQPQSNAGFATTTTEASDAAKIPAPSAIAAKPATGNTQPPATTSPLQNLEALVIKSHQTDKVVKSQIPVTPVNVSLLHTLLQTHPDKQFVNFLCQGLSFGFRVGYKGKRFPRQAKNLPSAFQQPQAIEKNLLDEVTLGRVAGPFEVSPFPNFQIHPLGLVPKKDSNKWRTIFHLSHPKGSPDSINANIPIGEFTLQYIRVDDPISLLLKHGPGSFMTKTDIQSAFHIIPVHPQDWELLGMSWQGRYYFDKVLPFGLRSAPFLFNQLSDALKWLVKHHLNIHSVIHILDDFFLVQPPPASHCATALCQVLTLFEELNIPIAPKKTFRPSTTLEFMGITLDSVLMQARLPGDKLLKARAMLSSWSHKRSFYLRELTIGTLQFACRVISPGRAFLQRIIQLTKGHTHPGQVIFLNNDFRKDVVMWQLFLSHWNGVSLFLPPYSEPSPQIHLFTDASGCFRRHRLWGIFE